MSTPTNEPPAEQVATPTVSTAPTSGTAEPPHTSWWHWKRLPHHLGRARTSTVILSVLFLAIFTLYLNVRPDDPARTSPAGGDSEVDAPLTPILPTEPTETPEPTEEPAPTTDPEETETPDEGTDTPTTGSTPSTSDPGTTEPTTGPGDPPETSDPSEPTTGTTEPTTSAPSTTG